MTDQWVDVVFLQGEGYEALDEMTIQEMADYMAQWDYGTETDGAHLCDQKPWGSDDREYEIASGGTDYVLAVNYGMGYASLNRRPITTSEA